MASTAQTGNLASRAAWRTSLAKATQDVFSMMVGVSVVAMEGPQVASNAQVAGTVGIAGAFSAVFCMRCTAQTANSIASQMLGVSLEEAAPNQSDAVGEICNIIAGDFKEKIGLADKCMLSVPTVITGSDYQVRSPGNSERLELDFVYGDERIEVILDIRI